jgi:hypothetical protein
MAKAAAIAHRSVLRRIRVASKQELKDRFMAAVECFQRRPGRLHMNLQARQSRMI